MDITWEQLLEKLPPEIAQEFRDFAGDNEERKQILLENYISKLDAFEKEDEDSIVRIIRDEVSKLP